MPHSANDGGGTGQELAQLVVNTADFSNHDLQEFINISEEIERRSTRERQSQRKLPKATATLIREEIFESVIIDDGPKTSCEKEKYHSNLLRSIENLLKHFDGEVQRRPDRLFEYSSFKKLAKGKVTTAKALLNRSQSGLAASPLIKHKQPAPVASCSGKTEELKKSLGSLKESKTLQSCQAIEGVQSSQLKKTKAKHKQLSKKAVNRSRESLIFSQKTRKTKPIYSHHKIIRPTCNYGKKSPSKIAADTLPGPKENNKHWEKQASPCGLQQLSVKDRASIYNKLIEANKNDNFSKHKDKKGLQNDWEISQKLNSVHALRTHLEGKLTPSKLIINTVPYLRKSTGSSVLDSGYKSKEEDGNSPKAVKSLAKAKKYRIYRQKKPNFFQYEKSSKLKRTQSVLSFPASIESWGKSNKTRSLSQLCLSPKEDSQKQNMIQLCLKSKEIMSKNSRIQASLSQAQPNQMKTSSREDYQTEDNKNKQNKAKENETCVEKTVNEIEQRPSLSNKRPAGKSMAAEYSDLGLTSIQKTASEDSQTESQSLDTCCNMFKAARKKKLQRHFKHNPQITCSNSDSDSDSASDADIKTLSTQPFYGRKNMIFNSHKSSDQLNKENHTAILDDALMRQLNSPTKIRNAYTLTILSSPSPPPDDSDLDETKLISQTHIKPLHQSWPSNLNTVKDESDSWLKTKHVSEEFINVMPPENLLAKKCFEQNLKVNSNQINVKSKNMKKKPLTSPCKTIKQQPLGNRKQIKAKTAPAHFKFQESKVPKYLPPSTHQTFGNSNQTAHKLLLKSSQFWISSGDFTAALPIDYQEPHGLSYLSNIFAQKSLETRSMTFGIDGRKFSFLSTILAEEMIIKRLPQTVNCSHYWFYAGQLLQFFKGPPMPAIKIEKFFNFVREFIKEAEFLRFGIDSYEFSSWALHASSPLTTSDLGQSDWDVEDYE